jgi:hypothetical protein
MDGDSGTVSIGARQTDGGTLNVLDHEGKRTIVLGGRKGVVTVGCETEDGDVVVKNSRGETSIRLEGQDSMVAVGTKSQPGEVSVIGDGGDRGVRVSGEGLVRIVTGRPNNGGFSSPVPANAALLVLNAEGQRRCLMTSGGYIEIRGDNTLCAMNFDAKTGSLVILGDNGQPTIILDGKTGTVTAKKFTEI